MKHPARFSMVLAGFVLAACDSAKERPQGTEQGRCYPNGTCDTGLACLSNTCVNPSPVGTGGAMGHDGPMGTGGSGPDAPVGNDVSVPDLPVGRDLGIGADVWTRDSSIGPLGGATGTGGNSGSGGSAMDAFVAGTGGMVGRRQVDLVVMVDNSTSMAPKVAKLNAQFPKLIAALKNPSDGTLPDLRVAIIDSDLGSGGAYISGSCGPKTLPDGTQSAFGDLGQFQMRTQPTTCTFNNGARFLEYKAGAPQNYTGDINTVFACLASNLGTMGCGVEHQLQAFEFALAAKNIGNDEQQAAFLRPDAYLGLVFFTDEDDCSAATNDSLFGDKYELRGESASLRCATRAHTCASVGNLADAGPKYPTTGSFETPFAQCRARVDDECGDRDTSGPTDCTPLKSVKLLAKELKALKRDPDNQLLVAGIFGWPLTPTDLASATYKIAPVPNPNVADTQHPTIYDYWPVCYDPDHKPASSTQLDVEAAGRGATGGLREAAFVDEFGANGMKFSICQPDFSATMAAIGTALAGKLSGGGRDGGLPDAPGGSPGDAERSCSTAAIKLDHAPSDILLVLDRSGSMTYDIGQDCNCSGTSGGVADCADQTTCKARWTTLGTALDTTLASTPDVRWGLKLYPTPGASSCTVNSGVEVVVASSSAAQIQQQMNSTVPGNNTPTAAAIAAATAYLKAVNDQNNKVILLATDGQPNCKAGATASTTDVVGAVAAIAAAYQAGFPVYVVGIGPSVGNLDNFAQAGGTARHYPAASSQELATAFSAIGKAVTTCTFTSSTVPPDPNNLAVYLDKNLVQQDVANGWSFGGNNQTIVLNGSTCDKITSGVATTVQVLLGCPGDTRPPPPTIP